MFYVLGEITNFPHSCRIKVIFSGGSRIFPGGGGAPTPKVGVLTYFFSRKLHENERIWTPRGSTRPWRPLLDPPLILRLKSGHPKATYPAMLWVDQEVQPSPFVHRLHYWLLLSIFGLSIVNVQWNKTDFQLFSFSGYVVLFFVFKGVLRLRSF